MQRIAVPMIGGMVSSTVLTLVVIPAICAVVKGFSLHKSGRGRFVQLASSLDASSCVHAARNGPTASTATNRGVP
jgi:hypothetical protein